MVFSYVTHSEQNEYYTIVFADILETGTTITIRFLPTVTLPFAPGNIDLHNIKHRDLDMILYILESYGMTFIIDTKSHMKDLT